MRERPTRVIRAVFQSPPDPNRSSGKEWCRLVVVVLYPDEVKRQLGTAAAAKAWALEIGRKMITDRLCKPPDLDALHASAEIVLLNLIPLGDVHRTLDDGTKVWLSEVARWLPPMGRP
jgi:hypothetical protein